MELDWPDEQQLAHYATRLAKVGRLICNPSLAEGQIFAISIHDYCNKMEQLFADDMRSDEAVQPAQTAAKQKAWIEKAKSTLASLQGERKIQAFFNFTPAVRLWKVSARIVLTHSHASS
jgi:hypothetical protein